MMAEEVGGGGAVVAVKEMMTTRCSGGRTLGMDEAQDMRRRWREHLSFELLRRVPGLPEGAHVIALLQ